MFNNKKLRLELNSRGVSQIELDGRLGVSAGMISKYVRGVRSPSPEQLYRFLLALGWTDEQLKQERLVDWYTLNGAQSE